VSKGHIDFSKYNPSALIKKAGVYESVLSMYFNKTVLTKRTKARFYLHGGGYIDYDGAYDFSQPAFREIIEKGVIPRAADLYAEATKRGMGTAVRSLWGPNIVGLVTRRDPEFVEDRLAQMVSAAGPNVVALK